MNLCLSVNLNLTNKSNISLSMSLFYLYFMDIYKWGEFLFKFSQKETFVVTLFSVTGILANAASTASTYTKTKGLIVGTAFTIFSLLIPIHVLDMM